MGRNILVTGVPGSGKTTLIQTVVEELEQELGLKGGGFYTREIRNKNSRTGFSLVTLDGAERIFAHVKIASPKRVGKYGVDVNALEEKGLSAIKKAIEEREIVVIDEIGKMELYSKRFQQVVLRALNGDSVVLATIGRIDHPFVRSIKQRKDICLLEISKGNRDCVRAKVKSLIQGSLKE